MSEVQKKSPIQVEKSHYFTRYDTVERFISYFYQIDSVIKTKTESILEIGIGNKTVSNYLKEAGYKITTCDFDAELNPDVVADIRTLPFPNNSFDTVMACEILEHLPFSDFETSLKELKRVAKKNVIISVPYACAYLESIVKFSIPFFHNQFHISFKLPYFFLKIEINEKNKEHYWELGSKNCSKKAIRKILQSHFMISQEFHPLLNSYHYFFILNK